MAVLRETNGDRLTSNSTPGLPGGVGLVRGYHLPGIITTGSIALAALTLGQAVP